MSEVLFVRNDDGDRLLSVRVAMNTDISYERGGLVDRFKTFKCDVL